MKNPNSQFRQIKNNKSQCLRLSKRQYLRMSMLQNNRNQSKNKIRKRKSMLRTQRTKILRHNRMKKKKDTIHDSQSTQQRFTKRTGLRLSWRRTKHGLSCSQIIIVTNANMQPLIWQDLWDGLRKMIVQLKLVELTVTTHRSYVKYLVCNNSQQFYILRQELAITIKAV